MTERDLKRRISDALLAGGLDEDAGLAELLAADPEAAAYARDAEKVDGLLRGWPQPARGEDGWEALASRIDQRLKDPLRAPGDMTLPPRFDDDDPFVREPRGAVGTARPGGLPPRAVTPSPLKPPPGAKPFTPSKPGGTKSPLAAPAKPAAPVVAPMAAKVAAPKVEEQPVVEAAAVEVAVAIDEPHVDAPELAPPPPGVTPEAHATEAVAATPEPPEPAPPATMSEPPMPISLPPDAPRESVPSLVPEADSKALTLANLANLDVKAHAPPPVPAAAHAKPPPTPKAKTAQRKDDRAEIASVAQPLLELPTFDSPIAAATKQAAKKASRAPLYGTLALAASVALGVGGWWVITQGRGADEQVAMAPPAESNTTEQSGMPADQLGPMLPAATPGSQAPTTPPVVMQPTVSPPAPVAVADGTTAGDDQRARGHAGGFVGGTPATGMGGMPTTAPADPRLAVAEADTGAATTTHHAAPRPHGGGGGGGAIVGGGGHATPTGGAAEAHDAPPPPHHGHASAGAGGGSSDQPPREEIVRAMGSVRSAVVACAAGRGGVAWVQVTFAGPTGRVSNALVQGTFAGTPQGSCIARAVRGGQVPSFHAATFTVAYPFQL